MTAPESTTEHLETGWEPATPNEDTVLRQIVFAIGRDAIAIISALGGRIEQNDHFLAADLGRPASYYNAAVLLQPLSIDAADEVISALDSFFGIGGPATGFCGIFSPWQHPDFRPSGWKLMGHPPAHYLAAGRQAPPDPEGVTFHRVETLDELAEWELGARGSVVPDLPAGTLVHPGMLDDPRRHNWIARVDGETAGIASSFVDESITYISLVGTLPNFQRRGIGTALTWKAALSDPSKPSCLLSTDEGRRTYDRMGFLPLIRCTLWYRIRE